MGLAVYSRRGSYEVQAARGARDERRVRRRCPARRACRLARRIWRRVSGAQGPAVTPTPALGISGTVLRFDRISQVPNQRVQLRSVDKGTIVGKTVTDGSGAFSFAVTEPGLYVVEALSNDGGIAAVGNPVTLLSLPIVTNVVLQSAGEQDSLGPPRRRRRRRALSPGSSAATARRVRNNKEGASGWRVQLVHLMSPPARVVPGRIVPTRPGERRPIAEHTSSTV